MGGVGGGGARWRHVECCRSAVQQLSTCEKQRRHLYTIYYSKTATRRALRIRKSSSFSKPPPFFRVSVIFFRHVIVKNCLKYLLWRPRLAAWLMWAECLCIYTACLSGYQIWQISIPSNRFCIIHVQFLYIHIAAYSFYIVHADCIFKMHCVLENKFDMNIY